MVQTSTWRPKTIVRAEIPENSGSSFVNFLTLFWMLGVIFFDKYFAYLRIGPIYITEIVLAFMLLARLRDIRAADVFLGSVFIIYLTGGVLQGRDLFFAIKDMSWMYYLFFLRFFPRNFPDRFIDLIIYACWVRILIIFCYPLIESGSFRFLVHKYRDAAVLMFIATYYALLNKNSRLPVVSASILLVASYLTSYKALMLCMFFVPLAYIAKDFFARVNRMSVVGAGLFFIVVLIYFDATNWLMRFSIKALNSLLSIFGVDADYSTGTAIWRAEIWTRALNKLDGIPAILFGEFPGHNFISSKYLGVKFELTGGDKLGVLRSAHNIVVQIVMKTGLVGLAIFVWYYVKSGINHIPVLNIFRVFTLILAMTADIFEVPSRGPLFYCFFVIIELVAVRRGLFGMRDSIHLVRQTEPAEFKRSFASPAVARQSNESARW